jgi:hypothetical protein
MSSGIGSNVMSEAAVFSETSAQLYYTPWHHIEEDSNPYYCTLFALAKRTMSMA